MPKTCWKSSGDRCLWKQGDKNQVQCQPRQKEMHVLNNPILHRRVCLPRLIHLFPTTLFMYSLRSSPSLSSTLSHVSEKLRLFHATFLVKSRFFFFSLISNTTIMYLFGFVYGLLYYYFDASKFRISWSRLGWKTEFEKGFPACEFHFVVINALFMWVILIDTLKWQ